jgi:uncharacterized membrane protein
MMIDPLVQQQAMSLVTAIASSLGTNIAQVWGVIVKQMVVEGTIWSGVSLVFFVLLALLVFASGVAHVKSKGHDNGFYFVSMWGFGVLAIIPIFTGGYWLTVKLNPEYYAVERISEMVHGNNR